jgi:NAD(P)-dependent dehydrogenase (short-subunit alcohol dehydrogenase family)
MGIQGDVSNLGDLDRSLPKSRGRKATLILCSRMLRLRRLPPSAQLPGIYDAIFNINVKGLLFTVQKAVPLMPDGASIILNASIVASKGLAAAEASRIRDRKTTVSIPSLRV